MSRRRTVTDRSQTIAQLRFLLGEIRRDAPWLLPCAVATGLCQALMYIPFVLGPLGLGLGRTIWWNPLITASFFLALSASMVADALGAKCGLPKLASLFQMDKVQAAVLAAGQALLVFQALVPEEDTRLVFACVGACACGFAMACCQLSSARFLARLKPIQTFEVVLMTQLPTAIVLMYALVVPNIWFGLLFVAFAPVSIVLISKVEGALPFGALLGSTSGGEVLGLSTPSNPWRAGTVTGCTVAVGALAAFVARSWTDAAGQSSGSPLLGVPLEVLLLLVVLLAVFAVCTILCVATKTFSLTLVFRVTIPPVVFAAVLVSLCGGTSMPSLICCVAAGVLAAFGLSLVDQMIWLLTAGFMRANEASSELVVTRMRALQYVGATLGACLVPPVVLSWGAANTLFVAVAALLVAFVVCLPTFEPHLVSPGGQLSSQLGVLDAATWDRCSMAVVRYGLTAREAEVLSLLLDGADASHIAEALFISTPTVNTHIRHIYAKFDVHSRAELVAAASVLQE